MKFHPLPLAGAQLIDLERREDPRGFFARSFCAAEFGQHGLETAFLQANVSFSERKGTLRGMHFQHPPMAEVKVVRCTRGSIVDVIVDIRKDSPTLGRWHAETLTAENRRALYVPKGFAHGFLTLEDKCEVEYLVSTPYSPKHESGLKWNDPVLAIQWPFSPSIVSDKDSELPNYDPAKTIVI